MEIEHCRGCIFRSGISGDEPAGEPGPASIVNVEVDYLKGNAGAGRSCGDGAGGMKEELPLALVEEEAEGAVSAESGEKQGEGECAEEPARADDHRFGFGLRMPGQLLIRRRVRREIQEVYRRRGR